MMVFFYNKVKSLYFYLIPLTVLFSCVGNDNGQRIFSKDCDSIPNNISDNIKLFDSLSLRQPDSSSFHCVLKVVNNFYNLGAYEHFYKSSHATLKWNKKYNNFYTGKSYYNLAVYFDKNQLYDSSFFYLIRAEDIFKENKAYLQVARVYNAQARILTYYNDNIAAENYAVKALQNSILINDKFEIFTAYAILGVSASAMENYSDAMKYHNKALEVVQRYDIADDIENECVVLNNIGNVYQEQKDFATAIEYYKMALANSEVHNISPDVYARLLGNYGYTLLQINNPDSYRYLNRSLIIYDSIRSPDIVDTQLHLAEYFVKMQNNSRALIFAKSALMGAQKFNSPHDHIRSLNQLALIDSTNETKYLRKLIMISDSINLAERLTRNKFARLQYETDELAVQKDKSDKEKGLAISIAIIIILIIVLILITQMHRVKEKEMKIKQNQQLANEEIYSLILDQQSKFNEGREREKKRISQDLHDGVLNRLASTRLNLYILNNRLDDQTIKKCLSFVAGIQDIEKEIRSIAHDLNNSISSDSANFGLLLEELITEQKNLSNASWNVNVDSFIDWEKVNISTKVHLYRILQEVFHNSNKYSKATSVSLRIHQQSCNLEICIIDNGVGFRIENVDNGIGLQNIRSRIATLNGEFSISAEPLKGTKIELIIPI